LFGQKAGFFSVKYGGAYSYQKALKGLFISAVLV
jgi:hypothetical protein